MENHSINLSEIAYQVKQEVSFKECAERYGVYFNHKGAANCPFHNEKTGSFHVKNEKGHCFGCGWHGDIIDFVSTLNGLSYRDALSELISDFSLPYDINSNKENAEQKKRRAEYERIRLKREEQKEQLENYELFRRALIDVWIAFDTWKRELQPKPFEDIDYRYTLACKHIDEVSYKIDEVERIIFNLERSAE